MKEIAHLVGVIFLSTIKLVLLFSIAMTRTIIRTTGFFSIYSGLSAALLRQATYSTTRFTFYETFKTILLERRAKASKSGDLPFVQKMLLAGAGGGIGSIFG